MPTILKLEPVRVNPLLVHPREERLSLDGPWRFRLDPEEQGIRDRWFRRPERLASTVSVPGCWQGQGFGGTGKDTLWDFKLQARVYRATYKGTGWYARTFEVPTGWQGRRLWLNFGGVHPSAEVWLNGVRLGDNEMPFVPFGFEVTPVVRHGETNTLVVRVHEKNREFGLAFGWQGNWSGLYRGVELRATGPAWLAWCASQPDVKSASVKMRIRVGGLAAAGAAQVRVRVAPWKARGLAVTACRPVTSETVEFSIPVPAPRLWSPDAPNLYRVDVELRDGGRVLDAWAERTGFVSFEGAGDQFRINGQPFFLRGSGDFVSCPETGSPDTDRARWRRKLRVLREYGYNYVRCQSYVYGPEYFDAADEVGLLVQSEMGMLGGWGGNSEQHVYQWPKPTPDNYPVLKRQWDLVVQRDASHPSANFYCMSNEYAGSTDFPRIAWQCYRDTRRIKPTAQVLWTDGGYNAKLPGDFVNWGWGTPKGVKLTKPLVVHEYAWWSSFPNVRTMHKYNGAVRPYAAQIAREAARRRGLESILPRAAQTSQRLQFLEAKVKMENCRRDNPRIAGICHFNAMDANPSPQGIVDEFYERKYADSGLWRQTNGDTVVLSGLDTGNRAWRAGDRFRCRLLVSDFSHPPLRRPAVEWRLTAGGRVLAKGRLAYRHEAYCTCPAGEVRCRLPALRRPVAVQLEAWVGEGTRRFVNRWNLWIVPPAGPLPRTVAVWGDVDQTWLKGWKDVRRIAAGDRIPGAVRVVLAERVDDRLLEFMRTGGRVILAAGEGLVRPHSPNFGYVKYFFTPPANYAPYEDGQNGTIFAKHPMLGDFPHEGFADLQFFRMIEEAPPLDLAPLDLARGEPVIRVIHRYPVSHPLGYLVERSCGRGGIIVSALQLDPRWPEAAWLLGQMCRYAAGGRFRPRLALSARTLRRLGAAASLPPIR